MPLFTINTNVAKEAVPETFLPELSACLAKMVGKPEKFIAVQVNPDKMMSFGGSTDPCAMCFLNCIGKLGLEENREYTKVLTEQLNKFLGISADRMYIFFKNEE